MTEIRRNEDGTLDEIVSDEVTSIHLEQMDKGYWWLGIILPDGRRITVDFFAGRGSIAANVNEER